MNASADWPPQWSPPADLPAQVVEDGREYHRVLFHDGDTLRPRGWHHDNVAHLLELVDPHLANGAVGLDYATGTGGSALPLFQYAASRDLEITLAMTDVMPSWFATAHRLLHENAGARFFLLNLKQPQPLLSTFGEARFDFIVSASTIHLLPPKILAGVFEEIAAMLKPGGVLIFNTGDIEHPGRAESGACLLHDVYRVARDLLHEDPRYQAALSALATEDPERHAKVVKGHQVFPTPFSLELLESALAGSGLEKVSQEFRVIEKANQDALDFIQVERLTGIAGAIPEREPRRALIAEFMQRALEVLIERGEADAEKIRTSWTFGEYRKGS